MYSILEKNNGIVKFLAESDLDLVTIIDVCKPGSTVEVLGGEDSELHTFIKSPSGQWVLYSGKTEYKPPKNDAKVSVPNPEEFFQGTTKKIKDYQRGVKIYQSGLVTGTLLSATVPEDVGYPPEQRSGHYVTFNLETPKDAKNYHLWTEDTDRGETSPCDGVLTVRMENMTAPTPTGKKIKVVYNTGQEFEFTLDQLNLA